METQIIRNPGSQDGPCVQPCDHIACDSSKGLAAAPCVFCDQPIGYETPYYFSPVYGAVHQPCLDKAISDQSARADYLKDSKNKYIGEAAHSQAKVDEPIKPLTPPQKKVLDKFNDLAGNGWLPVPARHMTEIEFRVFERMKANGHFRAVWTPKHGTRYQARAVKFTAPAQTITIAEAVKRQEQIHADLKAEMADAADRSADIDRIFQAELDRAADPLYIAVLALKVTEMSPIEGLTKLFELQRIAKANS